MPVINQVKLKFPCHDQKTASFSWNPASDSVETASRHIDIPFLSNITLKATQGQKIAIIGDVGSGKSSLLSALIGQMRKVDGIRKIYGSMSYAPQQSWLLNTSLRENILFGSSMDKKRYNEVVRVCALQRDFSLLADGDLTRISERVKTQKG